LNVFKELEKEGFKVDYIKVNKEGVLDLNDLKNHLDGRPVFASFMGVNNEIGTVNNLKEIREILGPDSILHSDLVQAIGKAKIDYASLDMMTFTSHKIYGLKGCGCFIKKRKINLNPIVYGGNQEDGLRSGTMDYPSICAFTFALEKVLKEYDKDYAAVKEIRDYIVSKLKDVKGVVIHDFPSCSPYILNISLTEKKASVVVEGLSNKEIYVNSVSACYSKEESMSYVIKALGKSDLEASNTIRLSFGKYNTLEEAKEFVSSFIEILEAVRN
jgi:Cysteine sulfinate desulfinase/cysteine desulfurase and related enzymes